MLGLKCCLSVVPHILVRPVVPECPVDLVVSGVQ